MLNVGVIGIGNAGSQVAALAKEKLGIDVLAINSSENDINTLPASVPYKLIGDGRGAGKEREKTLEFLEKSIMGIINDEEVGNLLTKNVLFVISSTGGGTGSGASVILTNILTDVCPDTKVITVGILPTLKEGLSTQINSNAYLRELYEKLDNPTYMLYDNDKLSKLPSTVMMETINSSIVNDIDVIRGMNLYPTKYASIDERDMTNIISTSGRIVIASLRDLKEKDLDEATFDDLLIQQFKTNTHCELQRDKIVHRTGIISNLSDRLTEKFDSHILPVQEFIGSPIEEFEHIAINGDRHLPNNVFLIAAGLTQVNDRIRKTNDRIDELTAVRDQQEDSSELNAVDIDKISSTIERKVTATDSGEVSLKNIFDKFKK